MDEREAADVGARGDEGALARELGAMAERERARGFASLAGSHVEAALVLRQALVDRLLARALASKSATGVEVDLLEGARVAVTVTHRVLGLPVHARSVLEIQQEVDLERRRIVLRHEESALWRTIRAVVGTLGLLPAGVSFGTGTVEVDLATLADRGGWADLLPLLRRLVIHGPADGLFAIEADLLVPEPPAPSNLAQDAAALSNTEAHGDRREAAALVPQLLADLAGSRARADLHVHESAANELLAILRAHAPASPPQPRPSTLPPWTTFVRDARVRFEAGRLVLSVDVEVPGAGPA